MPGTLFGREQRPEFVGHPKPSPSFAFPARGAEALVATAVSAGAGRVFTQLLNVSAITPLGTCLPIHCWRPTSHRWLIKSRCGAIRRYVSFDPEQTFNSET
ncbi:MAG: hypothetical protein WBW37_00395 [Methyloceanibacter sp.]